MRSLALLASLVAGIAVTGTASGSLDRTPRDVVEQAMQKVRPAPDVSGLTNAGNRVRVIVTLDDPPLAAATFARRLPGFGSDVKLNLASSFSRSYLGRLETAQTRAIASIREEIPQARVSRRYQVLVNGFAVSVPVRAAAGPPRGRGREPRLSELLVHAQPEPRTVGARHDRVLGADGRAR